MKAALPAERLRQEAKQRPYWLNVYQDEMITAPTPSRGKYQSRATADYYSREMARLFGTRTLYRLKVTPK